MFVVDIRLISYPYTSYLKTYYVIGTYMIIFVSAVISKYLKIILFVRLMSVMSDSYTDSNLGHFHIHMYLHLN